MQITIHIVDAFVNGDQGGNAAGVVLDAIGTHASALCAVCCVLCAEQQLTVARSGNGFF